MIHSLPPVGIDKLLQDTDLLKQLSCGRVALLTNQSALTRDSVSSAVALQEKLGSALVGFFVPEHGWSGLIAEGEDIQSGHDPHLNLPVWSLYGKQEMCSDFLRSLALDTLIIDLQDVGLRCYTYSATCAQTMEALRGTETHILVCDRPNPLGARQCGPKRDPRFRSIMGYLDVPWQHGQTMGQLLQGVNGSKLTVLPCSPFHEPYAYPWIPPSPNLPSWEAVLLYPALVMLEGTTVSEGRGTTLPFTSLGAPGLPHHEMVDFLNSSGHAGIRACPITFTPSRSKWSGQECQGVHLLVTDFTKLKAYELGIDILTFLSQNYPSFEWITGKRYFIDLLMGTDQVRKGITTGITAATCSGTL